MSYIHETARESYRHWWERQTRWLWYDYRWSPYISAQEEVYRLYPHLRPPKPRRRRYRWHRTSTYIRPWDISTSGESAFVQSGYAKKERNDVREDWRERKGFARDKAKRCGGRHHNAGRYGKDMVHRLRRQHERECIAKERYDEISQGVQDICRVWWD